MEKIPSYNNNNNKTTRKKKLQFFASINDIKSKYNL